MITGGGGGRCSEISMNNTYLMLIVLAVRVLSSGGGEGGGGELTPKRSDFPPKRFWECNFFFLQCTSTFSLEVSIIVTTKTQSAFWYEMGTLCKIFVLERALPYRPYSLFKAFLPKEIFEIEPWLCWLLGKMYCACHSFIIPQCTAWRGS